jgi:[ribosomal protein S18]-alanine N-acetyltransferase
MNVRVATPADADAILELERTCFTLPWSEDSIRSDLSGNAAARYWVAEADGRIVGYVGLWRVLDEGQIMDVAVLPSHRRRGVGTKLLETLIADCASAGIDRLLLEVREKNLGALALYEGMGFEREGLRKGYYPDDGDNAVLMGHVLRRIQRSPEG